MHLDDKRRKLSLLEKLHQYVMVLIIPAVVVPLTAWVLLTVIDAQKEIVKLQLQVVQLQKEVHNHSAEAKSVSDWVGKMHHSSKIRACDGCHPS